MRECWPPNAAALRASRAPTEPNEGVLASAALALAEGWSSAAREFAEHCGSYERAEVEHCGSARAGKFYELAY